MMEPVAKPKVSIIVPMYNVEQYVTQCLDSLLAQTLSDIEIIAVDDGSPDSSGNLAEEYATRDPRIKVMHRPNGGLGPARNSGIEVALGEYIGFVDSDDWVHPDMFERLYNSAVDAQADITIGGTEIWIDGELADRERHPVAGRVLVGSKEIEPYRKLIYGRLPHDDNSDPYPVAVWFAIYRKTLIDNSRVRFLNILSEDVFFNLSAYRAADVIAHIDYCGYCYRKDCQDSITRTFSFSKVQRYAEFFNRLNASANDETDKEECLMRARRKMVDYSRSYVFMVEKSGLKLRAKVKGVCALLDTDEFKNYCALYPIGSLPKFQSLFHWLLTRGYVRAALALTRVRMMSRGER